MYSVLFPGVFLHGVCRWSRMVGMHTCFSIFPSGLLIHGGPHRDPSAGTARAEKFTYLASSFVRLLSAIKPNMWKAFALARRTASLLSDYSYAGRGTNKNEWLKAFPGGGPDWAVRGRIAVDELRHGCTQSWVLRRGLSDGVQRPKSMPEPLRERFAELKLILS